MRSWMLDLRDRKAGAGKLAAVQFAMGGNYFQGPAFLVAVVKVQRFDQPFI